ncbi:MAG: inorganic phosphate transporter [Prolixibacteraceae bacterium]|jgi:phosphate/sulfate permease|nr:inorganic phosphate transporter [Prolixibacteraceae bacterium]MDD4756194.1 inorganic phosphate transporter [Prolixibacteraceae bacterium]NLO01630.1 inorganic phosphate transporter [Bacteroidales bacterium]
MQNIYLLIVVVLFALAFSDLIVGVSNDAVNFLNSAIGSKAAPKWIVLTLAALGVLIGATFSTGMMEVARKGVFHPEMFSFQEIMVIFLAVMLTDVILLDAFNTLGMPTSTTVSLIFELLGSAVAVSLVKIKNLGGSMSELVQYVNTGKALAIISGILISVAIAFTFGTIIQYLVRLIFSFNYKKMMVYFGSLFGGLAITMISYFILIKGIDGSTFSSFPVGNQNTPLAEWVKGHTGLLLLISLSGWTTVLQFFRWLIKIDILQIVVLAGTFALAMAFAGNDLVNFIGVPAAGFTSFQAWQSSGGLDPSNLKMGMLTGDVKTPFLFLFISGVVMIVTLITSKKAKAVTQTEVNLGRQMEGAERFGSSALARAIVRSSVRINKNITKFFPEPVNNFIKNRFTRINDIDDTNGPAFDKLRASVNLMVSSILIALGTSLKLPLSTTYVTFMVAMGSSLADGAWGRESAVYRVSGVFAVIGGWFLTALIAFTISALMAWIISSAGMLAIIALVIIAIILIIRTHIVFRRKSGKQTEEEEIISGNDASDKNIEKFKNQVIKTINTSGKIFTYALDSFINENIVSIREAMKMNDQLSSKTKKQKSNIIPTISKMKLEDADAGYFIIQIVDYQREISHSVNYMVVPLKDHLENQHKPFTESQIQEIKSLINEVTQFFKLALLIIEDEKFEKIEDLVANRIKIVNILYEIEKVQVKRIKVKEVNTRNSLLFFKSLAETKNMLLQSVNLVKSYRDYIIASKKPL